MSVWSLGDLTRFLGTRTDESGKIQLKGERTPGGRNDRCMFLAQKMHASKLAIGGRTGDLASSLEYQVVGLDDGWLHVLPCLDNTIEELVTQ
jgi:hypothetical protein